MCAVLEFTQGRAPLAAFALAFAVMVLAWDVARGRVEGAVARAGRAVLGLVYIGGLGTYLVALRGRGMAPVFLLYSLIWLGDTAAYFVGLAMGRRALNPRVSPGKTWEGALAALGASVLAGAVLGAAAVPWLGPARGAALGLVASVAGQLGDLIESLLKRDLGVKDSGSWIPGHGGALDRFDSLLLAAPAVYGFLALSGGAR